MTGRTGYTGVTNTDDFSPPADMTTIYEHFDPLVGESVATVSALPDSGNWPGRTVYVVADGSVRVSDGSTTWKVVSQPPTAWTPTVTGVSNKTVVAKYSVAGGRYFCDVRITLSASPGVTAVPTISTPVTVDVTGNTHVGMGQFAHGTSAFEAHVIASSSLVSMYPLFSSGSPAYVQRGLTVSDSLPFGFVSGDIMACQFSFIPA